MRGSEKLEQQPSSIITTGLIFFLTKILGRQPTKDGCCCARKKKQPYFLTAFRLPSLQYYSASEKHDLTGHVPSQLAEECCQFIELENIISIELMKILTLHRSFH